MFVEFVALRGTREEGASAMFLAITLALAAGIFVSGGEPPFADRMVAGSLKRLTVVDARGQQVGNLVGITFDQDGGPGSPRAIVAMDYRGTPFFVTLNAGGDYAVPVRDAVYYETSDCSGMPYLTVDPGGFAAPVSISGPQFLIYFGDQKTAGSRFVSSARYRGSSTCVAVGQDLEVMASAPIFELGAFALPLRLVAKN